MYNPNSLEFTGVFMPIYEYECEKCHHRFEKIQSFSDEPLHDCPSCGKSALKKCISIPNFQLKGSGWYETDFKKQPTPDAKKVDKQPKSAGEAKGDNNKTKEKNITKDSG